MGEASALALRAVAAAAGAAAVLALLGWVPAALLCTGRLRSIRALLAPLLGWALLSFASYFFMAVSTFGPSLAALCLLAAGAAVARAWHGWRARPPLTGGWAFSRANASTTVALLAGMALVFGVALLPQLHQRTLAVLVPNQDDEYYAGIAQRLWMLPAGWRVTGVSAHTETGWAYMLVLAIMRLFPWIEPLEGVPVAGFLALALSVPASYAYLHGELRLPRSWALPGAVLAALHPLALWTPGYGFGPNAAAIAATPLALASMARALRLRDQRSLLLAGLAGALLLMAHTKLAVILLALVAAGTGAALLTRPRARWQRLRRLVLLNLVTLAGGAYALYAAAAWGLASGGGGLLFDPKDTTGAGWGWQEFPSPAAWLGAAGWSLITAPTTATTAFAIAGGLAGAFLAGLALWRLRQPRSRAIYGIVAGYALFYLYARWLKAFPYALFKLDTLSGCLAVGLVLCGTLELWRALRWRWRWQTRVPAGEAAPALRPRRWAVAGLAAPALYAVAFAYAAGQSLAFYWQPWGPVLPHAALAEARAIGQALPPRSTALLSGAARLDVPAAQAGVRASPTTHHTLWQAERYGAARLRGVLLDWMALRDVNAAGVFERPLADSAIPPVHYDYVVLGQGEDPRFFGLDSVQRIAGGRFLALYDARQRSTLAPPDLASLMARADAGEPPALVARCDPNGRVLLSLPADAATVPETPPATGATCGRAALTLGVLPAQPGPASLIIQGAGQPDATQPLFLGQGLTWLRIPLPLLPATVRVAATPDASPDAQGAARDRALYVIAAMVAPLRGDEASTLVMDRAAGGAALVTLSPEAGALVVQARYGTTIPVKDLHLTLAESAVGGGRGVPVDAGLEAAFQRWEWRIAPGQPVAQRIDGRTIPPGSGAPLYQGEGQRWLRLEFQRGDAEWRSAPLAEVQVQGGAVTTVRQYVTAVPLPPPDAPAAPPPPAPGSLVRDGSGNVFLVEGGVLRWVPSISVFEQHRFDFARVQQVDSTALRAWPLGLPLQ